MSRFNLSAWAVAHQPLVLFLTVLLSAAGLYSYLSLGRAEDPPFVIKQMNIYAVWPGATGDEMQRLVADPIEKTLQEVPHFYRVKTYSRPGITYLQLSLDDATRPAAVPDVWYQVRKKVGDMSQTLPRGVGGPFFNDEFGDVDSVLYTLSGDNVSPRDLKDEAEDIRQRLLNKVPDIQKVRFYGVQGERIFIEFAHAKLATLGITPQQIFDSVARQNSVTPGGSIDTDADRIYLRTSGALDGVDALAEVPVNAGNRSFRLGDIATIKRGFEDPPSFTVRHEGRSALAIGVVIAEGANILTLGENLKSAMEEIKADLPVGYTIDQIADQPKVVAESAGEFLRAFAEALVIVLIVSFISLGWRSGIVVALAVPLVLAIVMLVMQALGMSLDRISLGALIIISTAMIVRMEQGYDRLAAASYAWTSTAFPMLTGTLVTAAGFLPVGFARSTTSEYAGGIFWVVAISLIASWVVAVVFTPFLGVRLLPDFKRHENHEGHTIYASGLYSLLRQIVTVCAHHRIFVTLSTLALLIISLWSFQFVQQQFFPSSPRPEVLAELRLPDGSSFQAMAAAAAKVEAVAAHDPDVTAYTTYTGGGIPRFFLSMAPELPKENYAALVLLTHDEEARERVRARLNRFAEEGGLPEARLRVSILALGPPVGFPVQFRVVGKDSMKVRTIAEQVRALMARDPNVVDPNLEWNEFSKSVRLVIDQDRARALGLTPEDIRQNLQTLLSGVTITQVRDGINLVDVMARAVPQERLDLDRLPDLTISTRDGHPIQLSQVAHLVYTSEEPMLWRLNRETFINVRADVIDGVQPPDATAIIWKKLADIREALPLGYRIEIGGAAEESVRANGALFKVFPIMGVVMLAFLMFQLQNFSRVLLVLATGPLGLIGATAALLLFNRPFGFVALLGVIALAGMIMRNTVILVDQIEHDRAAGADPFTAIVEATIRRARPVVLTALAAILAMVPLSRNLFWGPMASVIMGGLLVATVLTLVFVPALYALWFSVKPATALQPESEALLPAPVAAE